MLANVTEVVHLNLYTVTHTKSRHITSTRSTNLLFPPASANLDDKFIFYYLIIYKKEPPRCFYQIPFPFKFPPRWSIYSLFSRSYVRWWLSRLSLAKSDIPLLLSSVFFWVVVLYFGVEDLARGQLFSSGGGRWWNFGGGEDRGSGVGAFNVFPRKGERRCSFHPCLC